MHTYITIISQNGKKYLGLYSISFQKKRIKKKHQSTSTAPLDFGTPGKREDPARFWTKQAGHTNQNPESEDCDSSKGAL